MLIGETLATLHRSDHMQLRSENRETKWLLAVRFDLPMRGAVLFSSPKPSGTDGNNTVHNAIDNHFRQLFFHVETWKTKS